MFRRFRQNRIDEKTRRIHRETTLSIADFILPLFIVEGTGICEELNSMPEVYHLSVDQIEPYLRPLIEAGLETLLLFGVPSEKGIEQAWDQNGVVQQAIRSIKENFSDLGVICDVCICSFTQSGHCHVGDNDKTIEILSQIALSYAESGADAVAPSDMMDGRVLYMRKVLDAAAFSTPIISYAAKFASGFYGPFRSAADCAPQEGDRKGYQMDFCNGNEAQEEIFTDIEEGAAGIIVKPAMTYLDVVNRAKQSSENRYPIIAYNVSGEYMLLRNGVDNGIIADSVIWESLIAMKRAGSDRIISYFVPWFIRNQERFL